ncbi:platelet glycoprotein Ib alpha chain-like, partial [Pseudonaja textilis]|uniref:platelet glycoprotein Ib alpha chain-like n=1 Tax=Pseudonaja textilis TaxID=8673 RepID=UPI000EAAC99B
MLPGLLVPFLLAASVAAAGALPPPAEEVCETEMIKEQLQVSCVEKGLSSIPTGLPKATGILLLASNQLAKVDLASFQHLPELSDLDLSNNSLKALEIGAPLPQLKNLLLSHNGLESLPAFPGLPGLKVLALGHNRLSQLPEGGFRGLEKLDELQLQENQLESLPVGAFEGLEELKDLDLSDNRLASLPPELLSQLSNLEILRLERNRLERLPEGFFSEEAVYVFVYLVGNPWRCDCQLMYLRDWIVENEHTVYTRTTVQEDGSDKEVTENEPLRVVCQAPPGEKGRPVMHFKATCRRLGDEDPEGEEEGEAEGESWTRAPTLSPSTPTTAGVTSRASSRRPSTTLSPTVAARTTTMSTSALSPSTTHAPTTTSPVATTFHTTASPVATTFRTTASLVATTFPTTASPVSTTFRTTTTSPGTTTALRVFTTTAPVVTFGLSSSGGRSNVPTVTAGPSTSPVPSTPPRHVPTAMTTPSTPLAPSPTASMVTSPLAPRTRPPATATAGPPPSSATLVPFSSSQARISGPPATPRPTAQCLCPARPVRVVGVAARRGSYVGWLAGSCCLLRLGLYLACLAFLVLPTLVLLCRLGWLCLGWYRPARRGVPGSPLARVPQQWREASSKEWGMQLDETPRPAPGPRLYRVCKRFQVGPSRHVTWLLVSLPGSAGRRAPQRQAGLSSSSLDEGKDALGAVRVRYATASL